MASSPAGAGTSATVALASSDEARDSSHKRPLSPNSSIHVAGRCLKRRSPRACVSCHKRKVRCDVVNGGLPCTNCRLDDVDCILKQSKRGRKPNATARTNRSVSALIGTQRSSESQAAPRSPIIVEPRQRRHRHHPPQHTPDHDYVREAGQQVPGPTEPSQISPLANSLDWSNSSHQQTDQPITYGEQPSPDSDHDGPTSDAPRDFLFALAFENGMHQPSPSQASTVRARSPYRELQAPPDSTFTNTAMHQTRGNDRSEFGHISSPCSTTHSGSPQPPLPPYIYRLSTRIKPRDLRYLADVGCFAIPDDELRDELLRVYIRFVYPFMPAIDIEDFITPILRPDGSDKVSLLLFQAIMFVSITFVDHKFLQARGYSSRRVARKEYFDRVHTLYSFNCEDDRLALIQSLLLMTYWYGTPAEERDTWYWMGIALTAAQVAGFHRNPDSFNATTKEKKLRRRIWWSCVIRDRLIGLGIRRPSRIRNEDITIPPLALEDFDLAPTTPLIAEMLGESKFNCLDVETKTAVATTCVELSQLSVIAGHILHSQYTVADTTDSGSPGLLSRAVVRPLRSPRQAASLVDCDLELTDWFERHHSTAKSYQDKNSGIVRLCQSLLEIIYFTTVSVLHRPQAFSATWDQKANVPDADQSTNSSVNEQSQKKVQEAAVLLTKLAFDMQSRDFLRYSSTSSIPAFLSATLIHLLNTRSNDEDVRNISVGRFYHCLGALQQLQDMYASAEYTVHFIKMVLRTAPLNTPLLTMGLGSSSRERDTNKDSWPGSDALRYNEAVTAYPSPSISGNQGFTDATTRHVLGQEPMQPPSGAYRGIGANESWVSGIAMSQLNRNADYDMSFGSPYLNIFGDMDALDPNLTFMTFDTDPAFLLSETMPRLPM